MDAVDFDNINETDRGKLLEELRTHRSQLNSNHRIPHIPTFNGDQKGFDYAYWKNLVKGLTSTYSETAIIQAVRKAVVAQPAQIIGTLDVTCKLDDILSALDTAYEAVLDPALAWQAFYNAKQYKTETIVEWHTRISKIWSTIPNHGDVELHIKKRLWDGLYSDNVKESSRHKYDDDTITPDQFVRYLRRLQEPRNTSKACSIVSPNDAPINKVLDQLSALTTKLDNATTSKAEVSDISAERQIPAPQFLGEIDPDAEDFTCHLAMQHNNMRWQPHRQQQHRYMQPTNNYQPARYPMRHNYTPMGPQYKTTPRYPQEYNQFYQQSQPAYQNDYQQDYHGHGKYQMQQYQQQPPAQQRYTSPQYQPMTQHVSHQTNRYAYQPRRELRRDINVRYQPQQPRYQSQQQLPVKNSSQTDKNAMAYINSSSGTTQDRLIGKVNSQLVTIDNTTCRALLDSGSVISSVSREFYQQYLSHLELQSLDTLFDNTLTITSATGDSLNILGYIEVNILFEGLQEPLPILVTVLDSSILNKQMPALIGSNALELWKMTLDKQFKDPPSVNPVIDTWQLEQGEIGQAKSMDHTNFKNCAFIHTKVSLNRIQPYDRTVVFSPNNKYEKHVSATTVVVPKFHSVVFMKVPTVDTHPNISVFSGNAIGDVSLLSHNIPIKIAPLQHRSHDDKQEFLQHFVKNDWPSEMKNEIEEMLWRHREVFALSHYELGKCDVLKHTITLENYTPIKCKYRRIPPNMFESVKQELEKLLEAGVIEHSESPWCSPISIAVKRDGSPRITLDFRKINAVTKRDAKSVPNVDELFDSLYGKKIFSSLDMLHGFFQIDLSEESREITAFTAGPLGFYQFRRLPQGLCNSGATFQRAIEYVLKDLFTEICLVYLDDIIVHSVTPEQHLNNLVRVLTRLTQFGLRLKPAKCKLFCKELKFLGHVISEEGISKDQSKVQIINDWPKPTTVKEVRRYLGMCSFLRRYIKGYATIAQPLTDLLQGYSNKNSRQKNKKLEETQFVWTDLHQEAFDQLKQKISDDVTLQFPDFSKPFRLSTDACRTGLGAMIEQMDDKSNWRPICFASRRTSVTERQYSTYRLEFLCIKWAVCEKFKDILRYAKFFCLTDNNPLTYIFKTNKLDATSQRWTSALEQYDFQIIYRSGADNKVADALSRLYENNQEDDTERFRDWARSRCIEFPDANTKHLTNTISASAPNICSTRKSSTPTINYDWEKLQGEDSTIATVRNLVQLGKKRLTGHELTQNEKNLMRSEEKMVIRNNILYIRENNVDRLVIPISQQKKLVEIYHSFGHYNKAKTYAMMKERFYWYGMNTTVSQVCEVCDRCQHSKTSVNKNRGPLQHIETVPIPMYKVSMDFLGIDKRSESKFKLLTVICNFTKYAFAFVVKSENAIKTAEVLYRQVYTKFGLPRIVHTDNGATFVSKTMKQLHNMLSIKSTTTVTYRPQSNSICERLNRTIIQRLCSLPPREKPNWHLHIDSLMLAYNATVHGATGVSPFYAMFNRTPTIPSDLMINLPEEEEQPQMTVKKFASKRKSELKDAFRFYAGNIRKQQEQNKTNFDDKIKGTPVTTFQPMDKVLIVNHIKRNKIDDNFKEQIYEVVEQKGNSQIYVLRGMESSEMKRVHRDDIILFKEATEDDSQIRSVIKPVPKEKKVIRSPKNSPFSDESDATSTTDYLIVYNSPSDTIVPSTSSSEDGEHRYNLRRPEQRRLPIRYGETNVYEH